MKKVIRGRLYDTETAREVACISGGAEYSNDFDYWEETLYQKRTGEYFIYGCGGALSKYAKHCGSNSSWGERIIPLTYDEAQKWAENNLSCDHYISEFGIPEEDYSKVRVNINISVRNFEKIKVLAAKSDKSVSGFIDDLIQSL
jgi:hypothetical protein